MTRFEIVLREIGSAKMPGSFASDLDEIVQWRDFARALQSLARAALAEPAAVERRVGLPDRRQNPPQRHNVSRVGPADRRKPEKET